MMLLVSRGRLLLALAVAALIGCGRAASPTVPVAPPVLAARAAKRAVEHSPAAGTPQESEEVIAITYEDLELPMEPDAVFQEWMLTQRVRDLDGRQVRITGFMCAGSIFTRRDIKNFVLLREQECPYGAGGEAHHAIEVVLQGGATTSYTTGPLTVEGRLSVKPFTGPNGKTWAMYHLQAMQAPSDG
jgi:hypothetical protein